MHKQTHQAFDLIERLNNAAYRVLAAYAKLPYAEARAYDDPRIARLNRIIGRAKVRAARKAAKALHTPPPA